MKDVDRRCDFDCNLLDLLKYLPHLLFTGIVHRLASYRFPHFVAFRDVSWLFVSMVFCPMLLSFSFFSISSTA